MTLPYVFAEDELTRLICGDVLDALGLLGDESIQTVVTSPPYFGLRDYGTARWIGGDRLCTHRGRVIRLAMGSVNGKQKSNKGSIDVRSGDCACGARRTDAQIGLEDSPDKYVARLVSVFREVRRVLRSDGTLWLNLGDTYATGAGRVGDAPGGGNQGQAWQGPTTQPNRLPLPGLKPKDLIGIPWRVAFALQADGWFLRSDIVWAKPNPMPESVRDRPTKSHEYLFLLSKNERYLYDHEAIKEPSVGPWNSKKGFGTDKKKSLGNPFLRTQGASSFHEDVDKTGRNRRSVWTIAPRPYKGAHFATFPTALVEPCILAGSRPGDTVLDPFGGSGTVALVAKQHARRAVLAELSPAYCAMAVERVGVGETEQALAA